MTGSNKVDIIISSSMNGDLSFFDVERFATQHRLGLDDNMGIRKNWPGKGEYIGLNHHLQSRWIFF